MPSLSAPFAHERYDDAQGGGPTTTVEHGAIEVGFSPRDGGETLVLKVIDSARSEIRLMAYSFTSAPIVTALLNARRRGVNVALIVDAKENLQEDRSGRARHALSALVNAGCSVRTISIYPIMHDNRNPT
jgi:phosphatidylserine/phosphatidylglycerophosphate/cardiolipin synthase-like enzyme